MRNNLQIHNRGTFQTIATSTLLNRYEWIKKLTNLLMGSIGNLFLHDTKLGRIFA